VTEHPGAVFLLEPEALAFDIDGAGMIGEAVEDGGGQHLIAEDFAPIDETPVGSDDQAGGLVAARHQAQIAHRALAIRAHSERDQHRYPHPLLFDPDARIPAVQKRVVDLQLAEIGLGLCCEVFTQPLRVGLTQVHARNRRADSLDAPLVARDKPAAPLAAALKVVFDSCPRHRDRRRPKAGRKPAVTLAVPVSSPSPSTETG